LAICEPFGALLVDVGERALELRARRCHKGCHGPLQVYSELILQLLQQRVEEHGLGGNLPSERM
jgi:hypothetical protein